MHHAHTRAEAPLNPLRHYVAMKPRPHARGSAVFNLSIIMMERLTPTEAPERATVAGGMPYCIQLSRSWMNAERF